MQKIVLISGSDSPKTGGELYNYKISQYLEKNNVEQQFVSFDKYQPLIRLGRIPIMGNLLVSFILVILLYQYDGIFIEDHYFSRYLFFTNVLQRVIRKSPIITVVHLFYQYESHDRLLIRRWINGWIEQFRLLFANEIVTSSEYSKREIQSLGIPAKRIHVLYPGIDRNKFINLPPTTEDIGKHKILCVANYIPRKGVLYLIDAFALIPQNEFTLHLVGCADKDFFYYQKILNQVKELGIEKIVIFHDGQDQENIKYLYSTSDIFVLPSLKETFGIVLVEAMHYKLPIVTTNVSAMPDLVQDGQNGLLVPPKNSQALANALKTLMTEPELRKKMGEQGYQKVSQSFNWDKTSFLFLNLLKSIGG
ncbi:MAG: glycosyltransferase family 4 protein [Pleurocapsa sp. MO_226.B13]|nr:glycosyltransferase family 4 protein [Pleurocapsa sp. MO_226.B13]